MSIREQLDAKRLILHSLIQEIRVLEEKVLEEEWKDKPECPYLVGQISEGKCSHGKTIRGIVYCNNINCHK